MTTRSDQSAVIFDLDGTLTVSNLDFDAIRDKIGVTGPILEAMARMDPSERRRAELILHEHEQSAAERVALRPRAIEILDVLRERGFRLAILTRNSRATLEHVMRESGIRVDATRTREDGEVKPAAESVLAVCRELEVEPSDCWVVGDYLFDIQAGKAAGTRTVLIVGEGPEPHYAVEADFVIRGLDELMAIINP